MDMGRDLCRTVLIYENLFIPEELRHLYGNKDDDSPTMDMSKMFEEELASNKKLLSCGDGDSSGGQFIEQKNWNSNQH